MSALLLASGPADAERKKNANPSVAAQIECFKQSGANFDPETKRWIWFSSHEGLVGKLDMFRACLSRATGIPRDQIIIPEKMVD